MSQETSSLCGTRWLGSVKPANRTVEFEFVDGGIESRIGSTRNMGSVVALEPVQGSDRDERQAFLGCLVTRIRGGWEPDSQPDPDENPFDEDTSESPGVIYLEDQHPIPCEDIAAFTLLGDPPLDRSDEARAEG
jgi:hypothetical protein